MYNQRRNPGTNVPGSPVDRTVDATFAFALASGVAGTAQSVGPRRYDDSRWLCRPSFGHYDSTFEARDRQISAAGESLGKALARSNHARNEEVPRCHVTPCLESSSPCSWFLYGSWRRLLT